MQYCPQCSHPHRNLAKIKTMKMRPRRKQKKWFSCLNFRGKNPQARNVSPRASGFSSCLAPAKTVQLLQTCDVTPKAGFCQLTALAVHTKIKNAGIGITGKSTSELLASPAAGGHHQPRCCCTPPIGCTSLGRVAHAKLRRKASLA